MSHSEEVWKDIPRYKGKYQASSFGRIRNQKGYVLKLHEGWGGFVTARTNDKPTRVHRLVAEAFLPNPDNLPYVLHRDGDKTNNSPDNLCWSNPLHNKSLKGQQFGDFVVLSDPMRRNYQDGTWNNYYKVECIHCGRQKAQREGLLKKCPTCICQQNSEGYGGHFMYKRWQSMMDRCYNPKSHAYRRYGGRGIKVCKAWHSPKNYCEYWEQWVREGNDLQIDRIDNDGDYTPENCRLADHLTQVNNRECVKAVKCVETGKVYRSASEAQRQTGVWASGINSVVHGKQRTAGGPHWEYANR